MADRERAFAMRRATLLFALLVLVSLAHVAWWIWFQWQESGSLAEAGLLLRDGRIADALAALGADSAGDLSEQARRRRVMFISEGATLTLLLLLGSGYFFVVLLRERRLHLAHERFLTGATHELKTPLATVRLGLETLQDPRLPDARRSEYVTAMLQQIQRLEDGIVNLLTAAGLQRSAAPLHRTPGDLAADVRASLAEFRSRFATAGVELTVGSLDPVSVARDHAAVRLILHNQLDNPGKFTTRAGHVSVALADGPEAARLTVADDGLGIASDELPHVFDRFWRGSTSHHVGGTGLGLYLVKQLAVAHGWSVEVTSDGHGRGSCFAIVVPKPRSA